MTLPWPPAELNPNKRLHWAKRSAAARAYRAACFVRCWNARPRTPAGKVLLALEFVPPDRRRRDDDNMLAAFKPGRDGLADALGMDDHRFTTQINVSDEVVKGGAVRVRVTEVGHA